MPKLLGNMRRNMGGHIFLYDSRFGAYGTANKAEGKKAAQAGVADSPFRYISQNHS